MKRTAREAKVNDKEIVLSSGVTVTVLPFPLGLLDRINQDNPDPIPPKKTIKVVGPEGKNTEEVDNLSDPDYVAQKAEIAKLRNTKLGEATIDFCLECDISQYASTIKRLEKVSSTPYPDDPDERRSRFLTEYALRTVNDYSLVMMLAINQSTVTDAEVKERIASFQGDMARATVNGTSTPGADEVKRLDVEQPAT